MHLSSIVIFPGGDSVNVVTHAGSEPVPIRMARAFDRFATELEGCLHVATEISDELTLPSPINGTLYVCRPDVLERSLALQSDRVHLLSSRTVVVDLVRTYALEWAERLALSAIVPSEEYFYWQDSAKQQHAPAFFGLKRLSQSLDVSLAEGPRMQGPHYALLKGNRFLSLTEFLAAYLRVYVPQL